MVILIFGGPMSSKSLQGKLGKHHAPCFSPFGQIRESTTDWAVYKYQEFISNSSRG